MSASSSSRQSPPPFHTALLCGALAGTTVDLSLFPLDTLKTRLQSANGFFPAGGFRGIYRGIGSALVGSAPGAAFFFCTYEGVKARLDRPASSDPGSRSRSREAANHMLAASAGEVAACAVRVPTEVVKQRAQAGHHAGSSLASLRAILSLYPTAGLRAVWLELYRGWSITIFREVPFTVIQFPLWEALKDWRCDRRRRRHRSGDDDGNNQPLGQVSALESAAYGSLAGAVAAGLTTPLDVLKTRVMLDSRKVGLASMVRRMASEEGIRAFFAGLAPRTMWISIGGAIFLGSYQWAVNAMTRVS